MLSISNPKSGGSGGGYYFKYYSDHSSERPQWFGKGAELLGLRGEVRKEEFNNLLNGFSPDGCEKLVQNAGAASRQGFWDLTFSVPKAASVLRMISDEEKGLQIDLAVFNSLKQTLEEIEKNLGFSRQGHAGVNIVPASLTFALAQHISSRAEDPQLHWHCLLINVGVRDNGTTGALHTKPLFREKKYLGEQFRNRLAHELESRLGLEIEKEKVGFHIRGVPKELCREFSKRRTEIEETLKNRGRHDAISAKLAALETRGAKKQSSRNDLIAAWRKTAADHGWGREEAKAVFCAVRKTESPRVCADAPSIWPAAARSMKDSNTSLPAQRIQKAELPISRSFYRLEWKPLFPKAPKWSPFRELRIAKFSLGRPPARKWGKISWRMPLWRLGSASREFRIQQRMFFPKAPSWNPASKLALPALRFAPCRQRRNDYEKPREKTISR